MAQTKTRAANGRASTNYKVGNHFEQNKIRKLKRRFKETGEPFIEALIAKYEKSGVKYSRSAAKTRNSVKSRTVAAFDSTYSDIMLMLRDTFSNGFESCNRRADDQLCEILNIKPRIRRKKTRKYKAQNDGY